MTINFLIFVFAVIYFFLAWKHLDWAVLLMIAALPAYSIRFNVGVPMTLLELMILISFVVWLIAKTNFKLFVRCKYGWQEYQENRARRGRYPWRWEIIALLIISWIAIAVGVFTNEALGIWKAYFFEPILVFILVLNLFGNKKGLEKIIFAMAVSALAVSVLAIYQKLTGNLIDNALWAAPATRRVVSFFGYPNAVGLYLGPIIMVLIGYIFQLFNKKERISNDKFSISNKDQNPNDKKFRNLIFGFDWKLEIGNWEFKELFIALTIVISLLSIVFAKSEGAMLGLSAAIFIFGILAGKKIRWITLIAAVVIGGGVLVYAPARTHVLDLIQLHNFSGQVRTQQWKETWHMLSDGRLIFGAGLANYQKIIAPYHQPGIFVYNYHDPNFQRKLVFNEATRKKAWQPLEIYLYPHNILLNFWSELGLAGMLLFAWIILKFFYLSFGNWKLEIGNFVNQRNKYLSLGLMCAMIVIIIHGLVDVPYFKNDLSVFFWVMVAMLSLIKLEIKNDEGEK